MEIRELVSQIEERAIVALDEDVLDKLLEAAEVIRADHTGIAGRIRILRIGDCFAIQEQTPDGEILVRRMNSREAAERFLDDRLRDYDRMWNGCGCKIDYQN